MKNHTAMARLIRQLQRAYSGELAAARAYNGHWKSVRDPDERDEIKQIEQDELHHRKLIGEMLEKLGAGPDPSLERRMHAIGGVISVICRIGGIAFGWYFSMYGAGKLERSNVKEYEDAADLAHSAGEHELVEQLLSWAEVEWDHEAYFRAKCRSHWLRHMLPLWKPLPARESIRADFQSRHATKEQDVAA